MALLKLRTHNNNRNDNFQDFIEKAKIEKLNENEKVGRTINVNLSFF